MSFYEDGYVDELEIGELYVYMGRKYSLLVIYKILSYNQKERVYDIEIIFSTDKNDEYLYTGNITNMESICDLSTLVTDALKHSKDIIKEVFK